MTTPITDPTEFQAKLDAQLAAIDKGELVLERGHHNIDSGQACLMDLYVWCATGGHADHDPVCFHPILATHIHGLNDADDTTPQARRAVAGKLGPLLLNTAKWPDAFALFATWNADTADQFAINLELIRDGKIAQIVAPVDPTPGISATTGSEAHSATTGQSTISVALGTGSHAKAGPDGAIVLAWKDSTGRPRVTVGYVGENGILADTWYRADATGAFVAVPAEDVPANAAGTAG